MAMQTAFLGLGVMGAPMAGHLAQAGHPVTVYNRTRAKIADWVVAHDGAAAETPAEAARRAEIVMMCLGNDDDVRSVVYGDEGALAGMAEGAILVDHTTASADLARELDAACRQRGVGFLDAPVSGGQAGAENGQLTVMVGGAPDVFDRARPALESYARAITLMGPAGAGQLTKMVNQIAIAGLLQGLSEALVFAGKVGLDGDRAVDVIAKGAAQSWQMDNRAKTMLRREYDFGFAIDWMRKDLAICLDEARRNGAPLPVTALVDQFYGRVQARCGGRVDTSSLVEALRDD